MASLRKASAYSKKKARPYTRKSRNKSKSYIKVIPQNKIVKYNQGNASAFKEGKLRYLIKLRAGEKAQVRDNAIESCRQFLNKALEKRLAKQYFLEIKVYPHHILRNNKTAAGAGADKLSSGMKHSFGAIEGRAAMIRPGTDIFHVSCENENSARIVKNIMNAVKPKMPCKIEIVSGRA